MPGALRAELSGRGSIVAAQLAAEDFAREAPEVRVELLYGDHQNKPGVGSQIVRAWVDRDGVAAVAYGVNSAVALAVNEIMRDRNRTFVASNAGTSDLTGRFCAPTTVQRTFDTWALGNSAARAVGGLGPFFFIGFDYAFGQALERDTAAALTRRGGSVTGSVKYPLGTTDFSSHLPRAQASGAKVVAFASTGTDFSNAVKQAAEFGLTRSATLIGLFTQISDVDALASASPKASSSPRRSFSPTCARPPRRTRSRARARSPPCGRPASTTPIRPRRRVRRRTRNARVPGQDPVRVPVALGRPHPCGDGPGGRGVPPARRGRLPAGAKIV